MFSGTSRPWVEDRWTEVAIGDVDGEGGIVKLVSKGERCMLPNINTDTGMRDPVVPYMVRLMRLLAGQVR